jgi:hypothetical protein
MRSETEAISRHSWGLDLFTKCKRAERVEPAQRLKGKNMTVSLQMEPLQPVNRGRPKKFTPERIQQICNLVERGKSREEIAEIIGVTTGTLQVTCSKLGISLRRPTFDMGTGLLRQRSRHYERPATNQSKQQPRSSETQSEGVKPESATGPRSPSGAMPAGDSPASECNGKLDDGKPAVFAIRMEYKGQERSTGLPLDEEMIGQLALEAEIRGMRIGELVAALILAIVKKDLFQLVRTDGHQQMNGTNGTKENPSVSGSAPTCEE